MRDAELLPCPFCGAAAAVNASMRESFIFCPNCAACSDMGVTRAAATEKWNSRVAAQPVGVVVANDPLHAAAPDMLAALQDVYENAGSDSADMWGRVSAAIQKATGG